MKKKRAPYQPMGLKQYCQRCGELIIKRASPYEPIGLRKHCICDKPLKKY